MTNLTNKVVKIKKIQKVGENLMILLPKLWINEIGWTRKTKLVLEFLPHRKTLILSELNLKDSVQTIPIRLNEETSDIVKVPD